MPKVALPRHMKRKKLRSGKTAYYFTLPNKYKGLEIGGAACPIPFSAPLGTDFGEACAQQSKLIRIWDAWLAGDSSKEIEGSVDWVVARYKASPAFTDKSLRTRKDYDLQLTRLTDYLTKKGATFGSLPMKSIKASNADTMFEYFLEEHGDRQASYTMQVARILWNWAKRKDFADKNPFLTMGLKMKAKEETYAPSRAEYELLKLTAREMGLQSVAIACTLAYELVQRPGDVLGRPTASGGLEGAMLWSHYKAGESFEVRQNKTGAPLVFPMHDKEGPLFAELEEELARTPKLGTNIVMDEKNTKGVPIPMTPSKFARLFREVRKEAKLTDKIKFRGMRHGAATELGDAGVKDLRPMSGHSNIETTKIYNHITPIKTATAARRRQVLKDEISDALREIRGSEPK